ncbi:hypothetical protein [Tardisphaera saccharovorans]
MAIGKGLPGGKEMEMALDDTRLRIDLAAEQSTYGYDEFERRKKHAILAVVAGVGLEKPLSVYVKTREETTLNQK